ncbi:MAG: acetate--CoA ligase family protein [Thermodesulfobacteriota bacterium]|nr:acetate--CoA ligase family protein [Thermodesulfobacteriota bacterium]
MKNLLNPESIAVIGASDKPDKIGSIILKALLKYNKPLYPVHHSHGQIFGIKTFPDIKSLPKNTSLAVIATGAEKAVAAAEECAKNGIKMLIIVAGGFGETDTPGKLLEKKLKKICKKYKTRILGPNTLGIFQPPENFDTIFVEHGDRSLAAGGGTAFISQSGSVGVEALGLAGNTGFGLRGFVGLGNKCDLDELDFLLHYAKDKAATCLAFYLENITRAREFMIQAKKVSKIKPVVVLKAGTTEAGAVAASSHTGRLAGSDRVVNGAFRQFGIQRVFDDEELCDAAKTLATLVPAKGNQVALLSPAGGYGVMGADYVESSFQGPGLKMAELEKETMDKLQKTTFSFASCSNPVDVTASATDEIMGSALEYLILDKNVDIIICTAFFAPPAITDNLVNVIASKVKASAKPVIVFTQYGPFTNRYLLKFHKQGVTGFPSISRAVRAARFLYERSLILNDLQNEKPKGLEPDTIETENWLTSLKKPGLPDEFEAKQFLRLFGISVPDSIRISPGEKVPAVDVNPPFAVKVCSPEILHKTEEQGVMLNIKSSEINKAVNLMQLRFPEKDILLEEQIFFKENEFIVGAINDPDYGIAVMAGAGGILTELYRDAAFRLAPCSEQEADAMLDELYAAPLFRGYRGINLDKSMLARIVSIAGNASLSLGEKFSQLDINPIVFSQKGWIALDVKIILRQ